MTSRFNNLVVVSCLRITTAILLCTNIAQANQLIINGIEADLEENVRIIAGDIPTNNALIDVYIELLPEQTRKALAAFGFFEPEIDIKRTVLNDEIVVNLNVIPGSPVLISSINVEVKGAASNDSTFQDIQTRLPIEENKIFLSADYEATKNLLLDAAQSRGYFDFKFITSAALVSREKRTAVVNLVALSGPRFTYGTVKFDQNTFSDEFLNRWLPFGPEDPYDARQLAELTQNLQSSGYFSTVRVTPQRDVRYGPTVPILVSLAPKENNQVALGVGYSTDKDVRGKVTWGKPLINRSGHLAEAEINLSSTSQAVSLSYRIPRENQPLYNFWGAEYGVKKEQQDNSTSFLSTLNFQRVRRFASHWTESIFIRWERHFDKKPVIVDETGETSETEETGETFRTDTIDLILPGVQYARSRSKGYPFLSWGQSSSFQFLYGNRKLLSSIDFYKTTVSFKYLRAISPRNTFIFSLQYGAITTNDFKRVPVLQRYYAGGDRSIRGYRYQSIAPQDLQGNKGGRYLETGSAEYNFRFADRWSFAVFTDAGRAFNNFSTSQRYGVGVGIRWQSPVGPFRLDVAHPIPKDAPSKDEEDLDDFRIHLSLGPDI